MDLLGREAGGRGRSEVGLNPSGTTTVDGEAELLKMSCCQQDNDSDATVLRWSFLMKVKKALCKPRNIWKLNPSLRQ
jgi:hypothetical protein